MSEELLQKEHIHAMVKEAIAICAVPFPNVITGNQPLFPEIHCLCIENYLALFVDLFITHFEVKLNVKLADTTANFMTFLCGTILIRMLFMKTENNITVIDDEKLKSLLKDAHAWSQKYTYAIAEYWQIQCHGNRRLINGSSIAFFDKMPIYHPLQYHYLETLEAGSFQRHTAYSDALVMSEDDSHSAQQLADLPIWLGEGPPIEDDIYHTLNSFIADLMEYRCHLVIANGNILPHRQRMAFPLTAVTTFTPIDFLNYFGAVITDSTTKQIGPQSHNEQFSYETKDYHVTTKRLPQFSITEVNPTSTHHTLETYELGILIKGRTHAPYHVVVHNIQTPDNNPILLNSEQLQLIYKSVIKMKCEQQNIFIHCAAGKGRTGVMAYLLANLLITQFPQDPLQGVQWLRRYRSNVIVTPQQLEGAVKLSKEMKNIHNNVLSGIEGRKRNIWHCIYQRLELMTHLDHCFTRSSARKAAVSQFTFFTSKRKLDSTQNASLANNSNTNITPPNIKKITLLAGDDKEPLKANDTNAATTCKQY